MCFVVIKYSKKQKLYFITWTSMLLPYVCAGVWFCRLSTLCYAYETWVYQRGWVSTIVRFWDISKSPYSTYY